MSVVGELGATVRHIDATVLWYGSGSGEGVFDDFLGYVATVAYDGANPRATRSWVERVGDSGRKHFGAATYELSTADAGRARTLTIAGRG